jgi:hypothetical protein
VGVFVFCQAKKIFIGDVGGTFGPDEQLQVQQPARRQTIILNFMGYLTRLTKDQLYEHAELLGVNTTLLRDSDGWAPHVRTDKYWILRRVQKFYFEVYKFDLTYFNIELIGWWRWGVPHRIDFIFVVSKNSPDPLVYMSILDSLMSDPSDVGRRIKSNFLRCDYDDFTTHMQAYNHNQDARSLSDEVVVPLGATITFTMTGDIPMRAPAPADEAEGRSRFLGLLPASEAEDRGEEPFAEDDVEHRSHDNLYDEIPSFTQILVPQDSYIQKKGFQKFSSILR